MTDKYSSLDAITSYLTNGDPELHEFKCCRANHEYNCGGAPAGRKAV